MTKDDRATLKRMLHALRCYYPVMHQFPTYMDPYTYEEATAHNAERELLLRTAQKLVTKLCRKPKRHNLQIGEHRVV